MKFPVLLPNIFNHPFTYESDITLSVGDYVEPRVYIYKTGGTVTNYYQAGGKYPTFKGYLIKRFPSASAPT